MFFTWTPFRLEAGGVGPAEVRMDHQPTGSSFLLQRKVPSRKTKNSQVLSEYLGNDKQAKSRVFQSCAYFSRSRLEAQSTRGGWNDHHLHETADLTYRFRTKRGKLVFKRFLSGSQGQNLALTALHMPYSLDTGNIASYHVAGVETTF